MLMKCIGCQEEFECDNECRLGCMYCMKCFCTNLINDTKVDIDKIISIVYSNDKSCKTNNFKTKEDVLNYIIAKEL